IKESDNRKTFVENFIRALTLTNLFASSEKGIKVDSLKIREELNRPTSWLATDHKFNFIKKMFKEGRILIIHTNIKEIDLFKKLSNKITAQGARIDTIYTSNIEERLVFKEEKEALRTSVASLVTDPETFFVDSIFTLKGYFSDILTKNPENKNRALLTTRARKGILSLEIIPHLLHDKLLNINFLFKKFSYLKQKSWEYSA
ncbi:hypothetical protein ACFLQ1_01735, partial [Candidatus Auribacterota bacterium]